MVKKQTKDIRLHAAKKIKQPEQACHDTEAIDKDVDVVSNNNTSALGDMNDKPAEMLDTDATSDLQGELHASPDSKEKTPDPPNDSLG
jgi:hypothetical protein